MGRKETAVLEEGYSAELKRLVQARYPNAKFGEMLYYSEDEVWALDVYTEAESAFDVLDLVNDRVADILIEKGIALVVVPLPLRAYKEAAP